MIIRLLAWPAAALIWVAFRLVGLADDFRDGLARALRWMARKVET